MWREPDASQPGVSREQVSDLGTPRKNSTIRHPDAQIPAETQEAQKQPRRRGQNYQKLGVTNTLFPELPPFTGRRHGLRCLFFMFKELQRLLKAVNVRLLSRYKCSEVFHFLFQGAHHLFI